MGLTRCGILVERPWDTAGRLNVVRDWAGIQGLEDKGVKGYSSGRSLGMLGCKETRWTHFSNLCHTITHIFFSELHIFFLLS